MKMSFMKNAFSIEKLSPEKFKSYTGLIYEDLKLIARIAFERKNYFRSVEWFNEALKYALVTKNQNFVKEAEYFLKTTILVHDKTLDQRGSEVPTRMSWKTNIIPFDKKLRRKNKYKNIPKEKKFEYFNDFDNLYKNEEHPVLDDQFSRLCSGEQMLDANVTKNLLCYKLHYEDPYLRLCPFKIDVQNISPYITIFRDFFSDAEMNHYKKHMQKKSQTVKEQACKHNFVPELDLDKLNKISNNTKFSIGPYETIESMKENHDHILNGVSERMMKATSLYVKSNGGGEPYRIVNYGFGGSCHHHHDPWLWHTPQNKESKKISFESKETEAKSVLIGDRVATIIGYISDLHLGGATTFPNLGVTVMVREAFKYQVLVTCCSATENHKHI